MSHKTAIIVSAFSILSVTLGCSSTDTTQQGGGNPCGAGTVNDNGVCVVPYSPPPSQSMGNGATIYFWASASTAGEAQGKIYVMIDGYLQGEITGYATSGNPSCGTNGIYSVIVSVAPGKTYSLSAHDEYSVSWAPQQTPMITQGECFTFQLN